MSFIMTIEELEQSQSALRSKELQDKNTFLSFVNPDADDLRSRLLQWTLSGFTNSYVLYSILIEVPQVCSDGVSGRNFYEYKQFLTNTDLTTEISLLQEKLSGMTLSTSLVGNTLSLHVSKTQ